MSTMFRIDVRTCYEDTGASGIVYCADCPHFIEQRRTVFAWPPRCRQNRA